MYIPPGVGGVVTILLSLPVVKLLFTVCVVTGTVASLAGTVASLADTVASPMDTLESSTPIKSHSNNVAFTSKIANTFIVDGDMYSKPSYELLYHINQLNADTVIYLKILLSAIIALCV